MWKLKRKTIGFLMKNFEKDLTAPTLVDIKRKNLQKEKCIDLPSFSLDVELLQFDWQYIVCHLCSTDTGAIKKKKKKKKEEESEQ